MKSFSLSYDVVLYDISLLNLQMLLASLPSYEASSTEEKGKELRADDPLNSEHISRLLDELD